MKGWLLERNEWSRFVGIADVWEAFKSHLRHETDCEGKDFSYTFKHVVDFVWSDHKTKALFCSYGLVLKCTQSFAFSMHPNSKILKVASFFVLTSAGCGGSGRVAPVTPDAGLPGAIDAHWIAPHLDKVDGSWLEACQPTWRLVTDIVHHLWEGTKWQRGWNKKR